MLYDMITIKPGNLHSVLPSLSQHLFVIINIFLDVAIATMFCKSGPRLKVELIQEKDTNTIERIHT